MPIIQDGGAGGGGGGGGGGTVTSVALALPASVFSVSGSPVNSNGTLTGAFIPQLANRVFAAPNGVAGIPSFRILTSVDISDFDTQVRTSRLDQMAAPTSAVSFNSQLITFLANPISAQDAATKAYVDAGGSANVITIFANYTVLTTDGDVLVDATAGPILVTLPTAVGNSGQSFNIKKVDSSVNTVTVNTGGELIDGALTQVISFQWTSIGLVSDGTNWFIT